MTADLPTDLGFALVSTRPYPDFVSGMYFGALLTIALFGFGTAWARRDERAVVWFAGSALFAALWYLSWQARGPGPSALQLRVMPLFAAAFVAMFLRYLQVFLHAAEHLPRLDQQLRRLLGVLLGVGLLASLVPSLGLPLLGLALAAGCAGALLLAAQRLRRRSWIALPPLLAAAVLLAGVLPNAALWLGLPLPFAPVFWINGLQLALGVAIFATGIGLISALQRLRAGREQQLELAISNHRAALTRASIDSVTRLPDRRMFVENLRSRMAKAVDSGQPLAIVTIGLSQYRSIRHGMEANSADAGLAEIALRLRQAMGAGDLLGCLGPETFAWVTEVNAAGGLLDLKGRCSSLRRDIGAPLAHAGGVMLSCDFGIALFPEHGKDIELLLRRSDEALYRAERGGQSEIGFFHPKMQQQSHQQVRLAKQLRQALMGEQMELHYQPLVDLRNGELRGLEALIRWRRDGQMVPPGEFIPVAEASDLIVDLGEWVMLRACRQAAAWHARGVEIPYIAVNVSANQFRHPQFTRHVERALAEAAGTNTRMVLEITENIVLDDLESTCKLLEQLGERGVYAAVDDFGVGYSSLSYLRKLPVRAVKIDRSFLQGIPNEPEAVSVIATIIALGQDLGLQVIAEGIETQEQHFFLSQRGVHCGQGFLMSRALPPEELERWLAARKQSHVPLLQA